MKRVMLRIVDSTGFHVVNGWNIMTTIDSVIK